MLILLPAILLGAGCGDSDKAPTASGPQLTHDAYVAQADAICQKADDALAALGQPQGLPDLPAYAKRAAAIVAQERDGLLGLRPPAADAGTAGDLADAMDEVVDAADGLVEIAGDADGAALDRYVAEHREVDDRAKQLAGQLGMTVCAGPA